jgi:carbon-monoxide dehydrogenase medium subunit
VLARAAGRLIGKEPTPGLLSDAAAALDAELDPMEDQQASVAMRRHLARVLLARCVSTLLGRPEAAARVFA